ncbi:MAG: phospholipase D family protein [Planctomycetales bacterium]|nr:phospholipase D family protein [Planctomycetales bacterium]
MELYVVSAYLTEWNTDLKLNAECRSFRLIVGKDFGITRKDACRAVLNWLPAGRKADFLVADQLSGFHPKAVFWKSAAGQCFMVIGSSNLSRAAFHSNVEANVFSLISEDAFEVANRWIDWIADRCVPVSQDWLDRYVEADQRATPDGRKQRAKPTQRAVVTFKLPRPRGLQRLLLRRREQLMAYRKSRPAILRVFRDCAEKRIDSETFYGRIARLWSWDAGNRLQGPGWERQGRVANFHELAIAFVAILDAKKRERDDVVRTQLDRLKASGNSARRAFLSEMLCLRFPSEYPILNKPVTEFLSKIHFSAPRGASEGAKYIDLAKKLRAALRTNPGYPARNLGQR